MRDENIHPSWEDLLRVADGEMPERRAAEVRSHLEACWKCRARMAQVEEAVVDFVQAHASGTDQNLPSPAGPRAILSARMAEIAETSLGNRWRVFHSFLLRNKLAYACALILLMVAGSAILYRHTGTHGSSTIVDAGVLPNPQLTPGATRTVAIGDLCSMPHDEVVRDVPGALQRQVFIEYGVPSAREADYEVDYLITPGLGGADDIRNLWPQPHDDPRWNSFVKDQLEEHLHEMVCAGKVDLTTAQRQISGNWIDAYKKYFATDAPSPPQFKSSLLPASEITSGAGFSLRGLVTSRMIPSERTPTG